MLINYFINKSLTESELFKLYKSKQKELLQVQEKYGKDSYEAKNIIDIMEIIWYNISENEQKTLK